MKQKNTRIKNTVAQKKNRRKLNYGYLAMVFLSSVIISGLFSYVLTTPELAIASASISGTKLANKHLVQEAANKTLGTNILLLRKSVIYEHTKSIPEVKDISIKRKFPSSVEIKVTEWKPDACVKTSNGIYLAKLDGTIFHKNQKISSGVPLVSIDEKAIVGKKLSDEKSDFAFQTLRLSKEKKLDISKLSIDSRGRTSISLRDGFYVKMGLPDEVEKKIDSLKSALDCKPSLKNEISYLDVSCPTAPAYKPKIN